MNVVLEDASGDSLSQFRPVSEERSSGTPQVSSVKSLLIWSSDDVDPRFASVPGSGRFVCFRNIRLVKV